MNSMFSPVTLATGVHRRAEEISWRRTLGTTVPALKESEASTQTLVSNTSFSPSFGASGLVLLGQTERRKAGELCPQSNYARSAGAAVISLPSYARQPFRYRWEESDYQVEKKVRGAYLDLVAVLNGEIVGEARFEMLGREFRNVSINVRPHHRRAELATLMYLMAEDHACRTLEAPIVMTDDGRRFWSMWSHPKSIAARHRIRRRLNGVPTIIRVIWYWFDVWAHSAATALREWSNDRRSP